MLHTRTHKSRMVIMIKQLMPECTSCVARVYSGLCSNCPHWNGQSGTKMAERISQVQTREMLNKNK